MGEENNNLNPDAAAITETPDNKQPDAGTGTTVDTAGKPTEGKPPAKPSHGFQKRIKKLVAQRNSLEERLQRAEQRLAELEEPAQPDPEIDAIDPAYVAKQAAYVARKEILQQEKENASKTIQNVTQEEQQAKQRAYLDIIREGLKKHNDFTQKVTTAVLPAHVVEAALATDDPVEVLYHLGNNPLEALDVAALPVDTVAATIQQIAQKVHVVDNNKNMSPPISDPPGTGTGSVSTDLADDIPIDEWVRRREEAINK